MNIDISVKSPQSGHTPIDVHAVSEKVTRTYCFTDIRGSTRIATRLGAAYSFVLDRYRAIVREAVQEHDGLVIDNPGDGFFIVFEHPAGAVLAAKEMQQAFYSEVWHQNAEVTVRIGIHTGESVIDSGGYTGVSIHKAARICDAARGGQTLISADTKSLIAGQLPEGLTVSDLGKYELKDIDAVAQLYQLNIPGVLNDFPPPRAISVVPVVAVMPFRNLSGIPDQDYFCEGMSVEIMHALARYPGIRVVSRSSSFAVKANQDAREIGQKLNANAILEGIVMKNENHLRINVGLVETKTGTTLWTAVYDGKLNSLWSFQDKIAKEVADILEDEPVREEVRSIETIQTHNTEAYDYYLRGKKFYAQFSQKGIEFAKKMFEKAIAEDPKYALAYTGLADCYAYLYMFVARTPENLNAADEASNQAIALDPDLAEAHASRGMVLYLSKRLAAAETAFETAISLDPKLFEAYYNYGRISFAEGKLDKAGGLFREANRVRPDDYQSLFLAGQCFADLGLISRATEMRREGVRIAESYLELNPGDTRALYMGANGLVALGKNKKGLDWLVRALALEPNDPMLLYNAGCIYAMVGMQEEALKSLERAAKNGLSQLEWYLHDSNLDPLRHDPRFQVLIDKLKPKTTNPKLR